MQKTTISDGGRKEQIISAALELFLENGYEKTSIRMIAKKINCEVGLIYYYFKTKDDVFEHALNLYYMQTESELQKFTDEQKLMEELPAYLEEKAKTFRNDFKNAHFTVRSAICEKITALTEMQIKSILEKAGKKEAPVMAAFIASGLCRTAFAEDNHFYDANKESILQTAKKLLSDEKEASGKKREIPSFLL